MKLVIGYAGDGEVDILRMGRQKAEGICWLFSNLNMLESLK